MAYGSQRTPLTIKLVLTVWALMLALGAAGLVIAGATPGRIPLSLIGDAAALCLLAYQTYAIARLSRWPLITNTLYGAGVIVQQALAGRNWAESYPTLGVYAVIGPSIIVLALVGIHWPKMNWSPLGLPYRPLTQNSDLG